MKRIFQYLGLSLLILLFPVYNTAMSQDIQERTSDDKLNNTEFKNDKLNYSISSFNNTQNHSRSIGKDTVLTPLRYINPQGLEVIQLGNNISRPSSQVTAATSVVTAQELSQSEIVLNTGNALIGRLSGLTALQNGGAPPSRTTFFVRGKSTFRDSNPLVLIDGFERPLQSISEVGGLSVAEIQSVTVLKDAAALAKYGQRGANGAILVTTKRGSVSDLNVTASFEHGVTQPKGLPSMVNGPTYARGLNEARSNDGLEPRYSPNELEAFEAESSNALYPNVDWFDQVLRESGTRSNFNVSIEGGGDRAQYFVTGNVAGDNGFFGPVGQNEDYSTQAKYRRFNFRSNVDVDITSKLLLQADVTGNIVERNVPGGGNGSYRIFNSLYSTPSAAFPVRTPSGEFGGTQNFGINPVAELTSTGYGKPNSRQFSLTGRLKRDMDDLINGLSIEAAVSYFVLGDFSERKSQSYSYTSLNPILDQNGNVTDTSKTSFGQNTSLNFSDSFNNQHQFSDIVGKLNYETNWSSDNTLTATLRYHQDSRNFDGRDNVFIRQNISGNVHLGISNKYFFDVTASYSGSNYLEPGNKFGFFPAASFGWLVSNEQFLKDVNFLNRLKLRASWGLTGNDDLPTSHNYKQTYVGGAGYRYTINNYQGGFYESQFPTSDYTHAISQKANIGLEATFFEKLDLTADVFYDHRTNILTGTEGQVSDVVGNTAPLRTNGVVNNKGIEGSLNWRHNIGDFSYNIGGNVTFAQNEIKNVNEPYKPYDYLRRTGRQVGQRFGLEAIGFFENQQDINNSPEQKFSGVKPGDIKYKDQNGDGIINNFDEVPLENATGYPEMYFSFNLGVNYKGAGVSVLFQGTGNYSAYLNTESVFWPMRGQSTISNYYYNRRWTPQTSNQAVYPRLTNQDNNNNFRPNSIWLVDRSYVKLRNLEVYYSLPQSFVGSLNMRGMRIYARGMNLFSIDDIPVLDPENLSSGYPLMRTYSLGLKLQL